MAAIVRCAPSRHQAIIRQSILSKMAEFNGTRRSGARARHPRRAAASPPRLRRWTWCRSVVTKRLGALEARLGQRLFQRTTRRLSPTAEGEARVRARASGLLDGFAALENELQRAPERAGRHDPPGRDLRFRPALARPGAGGTSRHAIPRCRSQLQLTEQLPDLGAEGFDGAVWLWAVQRTARAAEWVTRRLARNQRVLAAAPRYLERARHARDSRRRSPRTTAWWCARTATAATRSTLWTLRHARTRSDASRVRVQGRCRAIRARLVRDWCLAGRGIMLRSLWDIAPQLAIGRTGARAAAATRCPTPTSTGSRPGGPRRRAACAC